jgi:hypothetical protein
MDYLTYQRIYRELGSLKDIEHLAEKTGVERGVLFSILSLKLVRETKTRYHSMRKNSGELRKAWEKGKSFLAIARELDFPPVLTASIILQASGLSRKQVWRLLNKKSTDNRITRELEEAKKEDFLYSPRAHRQQARRARVGEEILRDWLVNNKIEFVAEKNAGRNAKTPDFLLKKKLSIDGLRILWIESKAVFGDEIEHRRYLKKQYQDYLRKFGDGMVVYWYGFLDSLPSLEPRIVVKDYTFFPELKSKTEELLMLYLNKIL